MSETQVSATRVVDPFEQDLAQRYGDGQPTAIQPVAQPGGAADQAIADVVTAQKVAVKRNLSEILRELKQLSVAAGSDFFYRWEVNDKNSPTGKGVVQGPSIGLAMALVGVYGNCRVSSLPVAHLETPTHTTFAARFIDFERGVTIERTFRQRKNQNIGGRMDPDRAADIVYQIGQSKAMRNVVTAALKTLADQAVQWAQSGVYDRISRNVDGAREWVLKALAELNVPVANVEYQLQKKSAQWLVPDLARLFAQLNTIKDGYSTAEEEFPPPSRATVGGAPEEREEQTEQKADDKPAARKRGGTKAAAKPEPEPEPEPEAEDADGGEPEAGQEEPQPPADDNTNTDDDASLFT